MVRCNVEHQNVPESIAHLTSRDGRTVQVQIANPELLFDPQWGAVHHPSDDVWHTTLGTKLTRNVDGALVAFDDHGTPGVAAIRAVDLTR